MYCLFNKNLDSVSRETFNTRYCIFIEKEFYLEYIIINLFYLYIVST